MINGLPTIVHNFISRLTGDEAGQTLVEYAMIILFIAIALIGVLAVLAASIGGFFANLEGSL